MNLVARLMVMKAAVIVTHVPTVAVGQGNVAALAVLLTAMKADVLVELILALTAVAAQENAAHLVPAVKVREAIQAGLRGVVLAGLRGVVLAEVPAAIVHHQIFPVQFVCLENVFLLALLQILAIVVRLLRNQQ